MKTLIILSLLFLTINVNSQSYNEFYIPKRKGIPEPVKVIGVCIGSIVLEAIGDALYDDGEKIWGHTFSAMSTGLLVASPFILDIDKKKWPWYFISYASFRIALFDLTYNITRGLPVMQIGNTSFWDKGMQQFAPPGHIQMFGKAIIFTLAISISIKELK